MGKDIITTRIQWMKGRIVFYTQSVNQLVPDNGVQIKWWREAFCPLWSHNIFGLMSLLQNKYQFFRLFLETQVSLAPTSVSPSNSRPFWLSLLLPVWLLWGCHILCSLCLSRSNPGCQDCTLVSRPVWEKMMRIKLCPWRGEGEGQVSQTPKHVYSHVKFG